MRRALERLGVIVVTFEIRDDPRAQNLADASVQRALLARVEGGEFDAVFLAPPCNSFCLALQPILRSRFEPEGMTPVPASGQATCGGIMRSSSSRQTCALRLIRPAQRGSSRTRRRARMAWRSGRRWRIGV